MSKRAGVTRKVTLSVHEDDFRMLKERAKRLHEGNISAVFAELIASIKRHEAWDGAVAWYGAPLAMTDKERVQIDRELLGERPARKKKSA